MSAFSNIKRVMLTGLVCWTGFSVASNGNEPGSLADKAFSKGKYKQAGVHYQRMLREDPGNEDYRIQLAESYAHSGRLELAEKHAKEVLDHNTKNVEAMQLLGRLSARRGDWGLSKDYFEKAIKADPSNPSSLIGLSTALMGLGDYENAEKATQRYQRITEKKANKGKGKGK